MVIATPSDEDEMWHLLNSCYEHKGPAAVRYPRGTGTGTVIEDKNSKAEIGKAKKIIDGTNLCILNFGVLLHRVESLAKNNNFGLYDMRFVKPIDVDVLKDIAIKYDRIVTLEDHTIIGGAGSCISEHFSMIGVNKKILHIGLNDEFPKHGSRDEILQLNGLDIESINNKVLNFSK
tara:strand:- start:510 stop:1037 length:528 start_codon:yes stop_codon:yes gene_type:complete